MAGYPLIIELQGRLAVVVGGGAVGRRKAEGLLAAGARVRLVSRSPVPMAWRTEALELHQRAFHPEDLDGAVLAFAATGHAEVDEAVLAAARARGIPANLATRPEQGDFTLPAVLRRGDLLIAVATGGRSPALAAALRDRLAAACGPEWATVVALAARLRTEKLTDSSSVNYDQKVLADLLAAGLPELLAAGRDEEVDHLLARRFGAGLSLATLGMTAPEPTP